MSRLSWKKGSTGRFGKTTFELRKDGELLAMVQEVEKDKWFSYGMKGGHWNTSNDLKDQITTMKDAVARVKNSR